jgi:glutathione S-transferase
MLRSRLVFDQWVDEDNWAKFKPVVFKDMPPIIGGFITKAIRKQAVAQANGQGVSRHGRAKIMALGIEDLQALESYVGSNQYVFGDKPTAADATAASFLMFLTNKSFPSEMNSFCLNSEILTSYALRMKEQFFPDYL